MQNNMRITRIIFSEISLRERRRGLFRIPASARKRFAVLRQSLSDSGDGISLYDFRLQKEFERLVGFFAFL